ncbi:anti-sigma B factor antagonist [Seinonella peptonophila]|uniref:Anti-sigma factor antagonist n=1 Tax=Seinonella peptonophila TaxID=112248 RepID=A0A1M4YCS9_9BACL|nr:STAS domain-containing protein [Seinonella peptonophila]SHF03322.1 anti-sigma B factor antagonist [Seinonella peptonophila]
MNLSITTSIDAKERVTIKVAGEVDVFTAPELRKKLLPLCQDSGTIVVDLSDVGYIDSTGLGVFIGAYKIQQNSNQGGLILTGVNQRLRRLFRITGLQDIIEIEEKAQGDGES